MSMLLKKPATHLDATAPLDTLKGVGPSLATKLEKLHLYNLGDLILHFPFKYQDRTRLTPIRYADIDTEVLIQGKILRQKEVRHRRRQLIITLEDGTGILDIIFFNYFPNLKHMLKKDAIIRCYGKISFFRNIKAIVHPEFEMQTSVSSPLEEHFTPVYRTIPGVSQKWWRKTFQTILLESDLQYPIKTPILNKILDSAFEHTFMQAVRAIHLPTPESKLQDLIEKVDPLYQRIIFEEMLAHRLALDQAHNQDTQGLAKPLLIEDFSFAKIIKGLDFELTVDQKNVLTEIRKDLQSPKPMARLLQGDVGSGKTIVAMVTSYIALLNQVQVGVMAPTEVLAEQLYQHFKEFFSKFGYRVRLLTGRLKRSEKKEILNQIVDKEVDLVVGTHALFQKEVKFKNLGLVIIDEQHRFGVQQRLDLNAKSQTEEKPYTAHQLIMTATPIPRTLTMSYYAHLSTSQIRTLPKGRKPIQTIAISANKRSQLLDKIMKHCSDKEQVYWVCTLVEESENFDAESALNTLENLQQALPGLQVGLVHGKLKADEKEQMMQAFYQGKIDVLVATTVIEVGVNVPNATLMVIENAERLGLSQLHQLRGRVGRGAKQSYCILLYQQPLSHFAKQRIQTMRETTDGFEIAEKDLMLRGPGEVLGVRQSGMQQLKVANIIRDNHLLPKVNNFLTHHKLPEPEIQYLIDKWFKQKIDYAQV